jgi:hypothetical protein
MKISIANIISLIKGLKVVYLFAAILASWLIFTTNVNAAESSQSLGERMRDRIQEVEQGSQRPKTTGEFQEEAREGVPLDERVKNIVRDSKEAFEQFGKEYSIGAKETAREVKDKAAQASQ